jgi:uncharacterized protein YecT (DUF1311 family)
MIRWTPMRLLLITAVLLFLAGQPVLADEPACMTDAHTEDDINLCQATAARQLEMELGDLEHAIRSRFKSPQLERFDEAQAHWHQMALKDCEIEASFYEGAKVYLAIQSGCLRRHYQERMVTLNKYLCPEQQLGNGC